ncbi:MAG: hypothetical protein R3E73_06965 [Porticoccaceae bacterium]
MNFDDWGLPQLDKVTFQSTNRKSLFGGDAAFGPKIRYGVAATGSPGRHIN